jgi:hypothetical protein
LLFRVLFRARAVASLSNDLVFSWQPNESPSVARAHSRRLTALSERFSPNIRVSSEKPTC